VTDPAGGPPTPLPSYAGRLLVAVPPTDPIFQGTVVLVLDHDEAGALGLVLNRPGELAVADVLPAWADRVDGPPVLFVGGPVSPHGAVCLGAVAPGAGPEEALPPGLRAVAGGVVLVDLDGDPVSLPLAHTRVYAGYAGWSPSQLDGEVEAGGWVVVDLLPGDPWTSHPQQLWRDVLRRQSGPLRFLSTHPGDTSQN
jgi:putative transcriptional regulator